MAEKQVDKQLLNRLNDALGAALPNLYAEREKDTDTVRPAVLSEKSRYYNDYNQPAQLTLKDMWGTIKVPLRSGRILTSRTMDEAHDLVGGINEVLSCDVLRSPWTFKVNSDNESTQNRIMERIEEIEERLQLRNKLQRFYHSALVDGDGFYQIVLDESTKMVDKILLLESMTMQRNTDGVDLFYRDKPAFIQHTDGVWVEDDNFYTTENGIMYGENSTKEVYEQFEIVHARVQHKGVRRYGIPKLQRIMDDARYITVGTLDLVQRRFEGAGPIYAWILGNAQNTNNDMEQQDRMYDSLHERINRKRNGEIVNRNFVGGYPWAVSSNPADMGIDKIEDLLFHVDRFFAGSPVPALVLGFQNEVNRDILPFIMSNYHKTLDMEARWIAEEILKPIVYRTLAIEGEAYDIGMTQLEVEWAERSEYGVEDIEVAARTVKTLMEAGLNNPEMLLRYMVRLDPNSFNEDDLMGIVETQPDNNLVQLEE